MTGEQPALADRRASESVYQPAEDSALLVDAAIDVAHPTDLIVDVGTGSGYVAERLATEIGATVIASDIHPGACQQAQTRGLSVVRADLTTAFTDNSIDLITFNPPYLPTAPETEWGDWMERALSGGPTGRAVITPFLNDLARVLSSGGRSLMLASTLSDLDAIREVANSAGLTSSIIAEDKFPFERLVVFELTPK